MNIFYDTSPFIYLIEQHEKYYDDIALFTAECKQNDDSLFTSVLTIAEFGVKPKQSDNLNSLNKFEELLAGIFKVIPIESEIADISSGLRAKYPALKTIDALQLSSAIILNCTYFITNDKRLKSITEVEVKLIEELSIRTKN